MSWAMFAPLLLAAQRDALTTADAFALMRVCAGLRDGVPEVLVAVTVERRLANNHVIRLIARQLPRLQTLSLGEPSGCETIDVRPLARACPRLRSFEAQCELTDESVIELARQCRLTSLHISSFKNFESITDRALRAVAGACPRLRSLDVGQCRRLTDAVIIAVAQRCPQLEEVSLEGCCRLTDAAFVAVAGCCGRRLTVLKLGGRVTDAALKAVAQHCPELRAVKISSGTISEASVAAVGKRCPRLTSLTDARMHSEAGEMRFATELTDYAIRTIARGCPELRQLDVSVSSHLSDDSIWRLALHCSKLRCLHVPFCYELTDAAVVAVALRCPGLESLSAEDNDAISDAGIVAVARYCPRK